MNKKFIRVLGFGVGLFLAGSLSVNAQKVSFNGERLSLKQAFEKIESVSKYKIAYNTSQLDVNKQVVLNQKNQDVLQILSDLLKGTNCVYQVNNNYIVEVYNPLVNKSVGFKYACEYYNIPQERTIAIGDGHNDIELLKEAAIGVAMKNANPELLQYAKYVTDNYDKQGVLKFLKKFFH